MTILWDFDPNAVDTYRFALGGDALLLTSGPRVSRALEEDRSHGLVVIGPDIDLDLACELAERERIDRPELGVLCITHYQRLLEHLHPDVVHILIDGRIVESGGSELVERLEREGYQSWL